jgi:hypothetical protein
VSDVAFYILAKKALLIIGGNDEPVIGMNKEAFEQLSSIKDNNLKNQGSLKK